MSNPTAIVAEDEPALREAMARVLEDGGVPLTFLADKIRGWAGGGS